MWTAVLVAGGVLPRLKPRPPPTLRRVDVERKGTNNDHDLGAEVPGRRRYPRPPAWSPGSRTPGTTESESFSQYLTAMLVVGAISVCAPAVTPTPKPSEPGHVLRAFRRGHRLHGRGNVRARRRRFLGERGGHAKERRGRRCGEGQGAKGGSEHFFILLLSGRLGAGFRATAGPRGESPGSSRPSEDGESRARAATALQGVENKSAASVTFR